MGWDDFLFDSGIGFAKGLPVLVIGGYLGRTTCEWLKRGCSRVTVFEPLSEFAQKLDSIAKFDDRIEVVPYAAGVSNGTISIEVAGDRSSHKIQSGGKQAEIRVLDLNKWFLQQERRFGLTEINIEGAEYELLLGLTGETIQKMGAILLQTHDLGIETERELAKLISKLEETHVNVFSLKHVWEFWVPRVVIWPTQKIA